MKGKVVYRLISIITCLSITGCGGSNKSSEETDTVTVFKSTGAIQCQSSGMPNENSAQILINNGIDVISSDCGFVTNLAVITLCGAGTTEINLHAIRKSNLPDAENLQYLDVVTLENETTGIGYGVVECESR